MAKHWQHRSLIPNTDGYVVILLLKDGGMRTDKVVRDSNGLHRLSATHIADVVGWV